ncbi:MAG TPA: cytochrome c-type biogenesis CcmF C-terminal domain-containing protein [Vicinamibacteria bacterium]|nr:cytochrome c-type biogenesis CcmF C-terminal domain-containing protein [Vicinamibacteria bacterium]
MTPVLGRTLILLSLLAATAGATVSFAAARGRGQAAWDWSRRFAYAYAGLIVAANLLMVYALLARDFSVSYVAHVGSRSVPTWVAIVSLWSSLEGSILFWGFVLGVYVALAAWTNRARHLEYMPYAAGVWLSCAAFFSFLLAGPAQPFLTIASPADDGPGPNALLQNHVLMAVHPPFLYGGYVGFTIPFGLASAALLAGRLGQDFLRPLRTWLLVPWIFQTIAIVLGGWWAYEVLGWGGYWAWDPVENASLLPWLTATAALHSALLTERKGVLKGWTVTLVQASFLLTILGTFMTRSGVFNSVHSFTQSAIGPTILVFLAAATVFCVALLAARIDRLEAERALSPGASRDTMFLVNNLLFVLFTFTVLVGTVFPLVVEALRDKQMSVGRPYFDRMAVPIGVALLFLMGVGPALPWGRATAAQVRSALLPPAANGVLLALVGLAAGARNPWTLLTFFFGGYAAHVTLRELWLPVARRVRERGEGLARAVGEVQRQGRRRVAAYVVHAGAVVMMIAIAVSSTMGASREVQLARGESFELGHYTLRFLGAEVVREPHREATVARIEVSRAGRVLEIMEPAMNQYGNQREPIGTPAVRSAALEDLYLSVMNVDAEAQALGLHALVNPLVGWIWAAMFVMAAGSVFALVPVRRRPAEGAAAAEAVPAGAAASGS